jgi:hypothetical protein
MEAIILKNYISGRDDILNALGKKIPIYITGDRS